jgi:NADPH:quinone reductase-like Zn-dependent oxidoreductase
MKCYQVDGKGIDQLKLIDCPAPEIIQDHDVLIDVKACALNYRDLLVIKGQYGPGPYPPFIPVSDMSGVVRAVGSKVADFKPGDRVLNAPFQHWPAGIMRSNWARTFVGGAGVDGVLAEQITYPEDALVKVPSFLNFNEAATLTIAGLTAWASIVTHGKTRPGEWVLLQGTGGVSIFAAQLARACGARVILTTSSPSKAEEVKKRYGITATIDYRQPDWYKEVKNITQGHGADVVVDVVGGDTLAQSMQACAYGARVAIVGILSGFESKIRLFDVMQHQIQLKGVFMESTEELRTFVTAVDALQLKPAVDRVFSFDQAVEAYRYLESQKHIGKVVITLP